MAVHPLSTNRNTGTVDLIGIGAQKAGTTWLHARLSQVPGIHMPFVKEIHYFDRDRRYPSPNDLTEASLLRRLAIRDWRKRMKADIMEAIRSKDMERIAWYRKYHFGRYSDKWYLELMSMRGGITGDITPAYSILDEADVIHMKALLPNTKIIYLLRDPIDRAWSHYRYDAMRRGTSPNLDPIRIIEFMERPHQTRRGDYIRTLNVYEKHFGAENMLIGFYDAIAQRPEELLSGVITFIGAEHPSPARGTSLSQRFNESPMTHMPEPVRDRLLQMYLPMIQTLAERFGGCCSQWLDRWTHGGTDSGTWTSSCFTLDQKPRTLNWPVQ